jgi:hypothetical protein
VGLSQDRRSKYKSRPEKVLFASTRHVFPAIIDLRSAVATHAISSFVDSENTAQLSVVAAKEPLKTTTHFSIANPAFSCYACEPYL